MLAAIAADGSHSAASLFSSLSLHLSRRIKSVMPNTKPCSLAAMQSLVSVVKNKVYI